MSVLIRNTEWGQLRRQPHALIRPHSHRIAGLKPLSPGQAHDGQATLSPPSPRVLRRMASPAQWVPPGEPPCFLPQAVNPSEAELLHPVRRLLHVACDEPTLKSPGA